MKKITTNIEQNFKQDFVVNGEGCSNDCAWHYSWIEDGKLGCGWDYSAFLSERL